jgi:sugar phosphate isomerase/epimerase
MQLSRRQMLSCTVKAAAALGLAASAVCPTQAAAKRRLKIGACEWSLRKGDPSSLAVAKEIGLDGVQVNMGSLGNKMWLRQPEVQRAYLDAARQHGVAIGGLALGELNNIPLKSDLRAAVWLVDSVDVAKALGVKVLLVAQFYKGDLKGDPEGIRRTVEVLQEVAPRAERAGVILGLENYLSAEENLDIVERVKSPAVQVYYDVGNSTDKGYNVYNEIRLLKGRICEFHFKDGGFMLGQGRIDFAKVREAMDEIGYEGWAQIEAAAPKDLVNDYKAHLAFLRRVFEA